MKRHLEKLKAAKASSHGRSFGGDDASTASKLLAPREEMGYWAGATPPFARGVSKFPNKKMIPEDHTF